MDQPRTWRAFTRVYPNFTTLKTTSASPFCVSSPLAVRVVGCLQLRLSRERLVVGEITGGFKIEALGSDLIAANGGPDDG